MVILPQLIRISRNFKLFPVVGICYFVLILFLKGYFFLDPDFGWHLGIGRYILSHGIPKTDPFSYTMPSYPFIDHEWLTNIIIFKLYSFIGTWGLSLVSAIIVLLALLISLPGNLNKWSIVPLFLSAVTILPFTGIRPQIETWFFLAILLKVVFDQKLWKKLRLAVPVLFIIWVNLHGGFAVGIASLFIILTLRFWEEKKVNTTDLTVFLSCIAATFLNPYGIKIWYEVWMQISDGGLRWTIVEWTPIFFRVDGAYLFYLSFSSLIIWRYRKKLKLPRVGLVFFLALAGISSQRHIPLWLIAALPAVSLSLQYFYEEVKGKPISLKRFNQAHRTLIAITLVALAIFSYYTVKNMGPDESKEYPQKAVDFLKAQNQGNRIFALYSWGGYLIWKLPEEKVFIDGRMPSWRWASPYQSESNWAFKEYNKAVDDEKALTEIFAKYKVNTVLWPTPDQKDQQKTPVRNFLSMIEGKLSNKEPAKSLLENLLALGWKKIYQDKTATIYQKL